MVSCHWRRDKGEAQAWINMLSQSVRLNRVIIVVAGSTDGGPSVDAGCRNIVIKDAKDWIGLVVQQRRHLEVTWQLRPLRTADGACNIAMSDVGGDAQEVERVGALGCEYRWPVTVVNATAAGAKGLQTYCTEVLHTNTVQNSIVNIQNLRTCGIRLECKTAVHRSSNKESLQLGFDGKHNL